MVLDDGVEFLGQQMERHERAAIGVDQDDVVFVLQLLQEQPSVAIGDMEVGLLLDAEIFLGEFQHGRIELDRGHLRVGQELVQIPGGAAAAKADFQHRMNVLGVHQGRGHEAGIADRQVALVFRIVDALGVDAPVVTEGHAAVGRLVVHVNVIVEQLLGLQQVAGVLRRSGCGEQGARQHAENDRSDEHRRFCFPRLRRLGRARLTANSAGSCGRNLARGRADGT